MGYRRALILGLVLFVHAAQAAPAAWYQWRSIADGSLFCAQVSPGAGWEKFAGPFENARCMDQPGRSLL